jgi:hypothetical protein
MCHNAIMMVPLNYWLWHELCRYYAARNDLNGAIQACERGSRMSPTNPSPIMVLSNLYAAKGEFRAAAKSSAKLSQIGTDWIRLAFRTAASKPYETMLKISLDRSVILNNS